MNELKNLQCVGLTTLGTALKNAFDVLNLNRAQHAIDTYGQGRCPYYLEPSIIVVITDGGKYTTMDGVPKDVSISLTFFQQDRQSVCLNDVCLPPQIPKVMIEFREYIMRFQRKTL